MDVGFYLSELLMQQGEVSIPGLGIFERLRMSGYYDESERTFYPPYHRATFKAGASDIDPLSDHIALKKHISVASAGYFVEKYVSNIKQESLTGEVPVGNLGWFYMADDRLVFKPSDKLTDDSIFYGLEPVGIAKTTATIPEEEPVWHHDEGVAAVTDIVHEEESEPVSEQVVFENTYQAHPVEFYNRKDETSTAYSYVNTESDERRSPLRIFLIVVVIILLLDTIILGIYRYDPGAFSKMAFWESNTKVTDTVKHNMVAPIKVADTANTDSIDAADSTQKKTDTVAKAVNTAPVIKKTEVKNTPPVVADKKTEQPVAKLPAPAVKPATTTVQTAAAVKPIVTTKAAALDTGALKPSDAVGTRRFEVYALTCKTMPTALRYAEKLRKKGLDPRLVTDGPGKFIHITVGHFATEKEARAYAVKLEESGKVSTDAYPREIIPQK